MLHQEEFELREVSFNLCNKSSGYGLQGAIQSHCQAQRRPNRQQSNQIAMNSYFRLSSGESGSLDVFPWY